MNTTVGGSTVTGSGTASASDSTFGAAANAFNGNLNDFWASGTNQEQWLEYDFGGAYSPAIVEIQLWARNDGTDQNQMPAEFVVQWSDDDTNWTSVDHCFHAGWTSGQAVRFPFPTFALGGAHEWWGLELLTVNASTAFGLAELQVRTTVGGSQALTGGTPAASQVSGAFVAANAFDGNLTTYWSSTDTRSYQSLTYGGMVSTIACAQVALTSNPLSPSLFDPATFNVICSDDGVNWAIEYACTASTWSGTQSTQTFTNPNSSISATGTGPVGTITLSAPTGYGSVSVTATGQIGTITLTAPDGYGSGGSTATGMIGTITLSAPTGGATVDVIGTGPVGTITLSAPTGGAYSSVQEQASKIVGYGVTGPTTSTSELSTKIVGYGGLGTNDATTASAKIVAYGIISTAPAVRRTAAVRLFVGSKS